MSSDVKQELDPNGKSAHDVGSKLDVGKIKPAMVLSGFTQALMELGRWESRIQSLAESFQLSYRAMFIMANAHSMRGEKCDNGVVPYDVIMMWASLRMLQKEVAALRANHQPMFVKMPILVGHKATQVIEHPSWNFSLRDIANFDVIYENYALALEEVARVGSIGAEKYTPFGWVFVLDGINRYTEAGYRHFLKAQQGLVYDDEYGGIGTLHTAQTAWNMIAVVELRKRNESRKVL